MRHIFIALAVLFALLTSCIDSDSYNSGDLPEAKANSSKPKDSLIALLATMTADTFDCTADIYWKIIQRGKSSIPLLIESLIDTRMTNIYDNCKHGKLNVGEVSYFALQEIAEFPAFLVTQIQFDVVVNNCWNFYDYFFDNKNKQAYQKMVRDFYDTYKTTKYVFVKYDEKELNKCHRFYKIEGKLRWTE